MFDSNPNIQATGVNNGSVQIQKWAPLAILVLTALIYSRALANTLTDFDDNDFITNNPLIRNTSWEGITALFTSVYSGKYQPFINLSFLLEYKFFGLDPVVFHTTNVLLHLACTWVAYQFTLRLGGNKITAIVVMALFALHPMHVEDVAWASERKDVLYALFYLLALLFYMKYIGSNLRLKYYIIMLLFFAVSLFSKSSAMTLPLILIAIDIYKGRRMNIRMWLEKIPLVAIIVVYQVIGSLSHHAAGIVYHLPAGLSFINRIFLAAYVPSFYFIKLFVPFGLSAMYYYPYVAFTGALPWMYYGSIPLLAIVAWLVFRRSALRKEMIFGMAFFAITIAVMEQIIGVGPSITPERYTYIPYIGLFYIIGQWLSDIKAIKLQKIAFGIFAVFLIICSVQTWARIATWKDSDSIFADIIAKNEGSPDSYYIYFIRGDLRMGEGNLREAVADYNQAIIINPYYAMAYNNRATALFQLGDPKSALSDFNDAIRLEPKKHKQYNNRASLKASMGDFQGAIIDYNYYLTLEPADGRAYTDRGMARLSQQDSTGACADWKHAMNLGNEQAPKLLRQFCH
jgi:regulator of sirC expression with transglutaminase-like and TPR domain